MMACFMSAAICATSSLTADITLDLFNELNNPGFQLQQQHQTIDSGVPENAKASEVKTDSQAKPTEEIDLLPHQGNL